MSNIHTDKIQRLINKSVENKMNELNKKLIVNNTIGDSYITVNIIMTSTKAELN